jgi:hypothetical protein
LSTPAKYLVCRVRWDIFSIGCINNILLGFNASDESILSWGVVLGTRSTNRRHLEQKNAVVIVENEPPQHNTTSEHVGT